jgi:hypothetical protein
MDNGEIRSKGWEYGEEAVCAGREHVLQWYVARRSTVLRKNARDLTHEAARNNHVHVLQYLRDQGAACEHWECFHYPEVGATDATMRWLHDGAAYEHLPCMQRPEPCDCGHWACPDS